MSPAEQVRPDPGLALLALYDDALPQVYGYLLARRGERTLAEVGDPDGVVTRAVALGARLERPVMDAPYGRAVAS